MTGNAPTIDIGAAARAVDAALFDVEHELDWLTRLTPTHNAARWHAFVASGHRRAPALTYRPLDIDLGAVRSRLDRVDVEAVGEPALRALLGEKRDELGAQAELLACREADGFTAASVRLFGGADPSLLADALEILSEVPVLAEPVADTVGADEVVAAARAARARYAALAPDFDFRIDMIDDTDSVLAVHCGHLQVDAALAVPRARVAPLVAHEVGVHVVTRYNGRQQPLKLLESGLAYYDVLQEGLATLAEYLAGCLPASRLRTLAARVLAADLVVRGAGLEDVFDSLHREHGFAAEAAFDVAVRARRGGGLTKDAVYLGGLRELLAHLAVGGEIEPLFLGKHALSQRHLMSDLLASGTLVPPRLLPDCLTSDAGRARLETARVTPVTRLHQ